MSELEPEKALIRTERFGKNGFAQIQDWSDEAKIVAEIDRRNQERLESENPNAEVNRWLQEMLDRSNLQII